MSPRSFSLFVLSACSVLLSALAQSEPRAPKAAEADFVAQAAKSGQLAVELGRVAMRKSADALVQNYGKSMATEHQAAGDRLKKVADARGYAVPTLLDEQGQLLVEDLQKATGKDFDHRYVRQMVAEHRRVIGEFEKYAAEGQDSELKAWVTETLPVLKTHLAKAEEIQRSMS